MRTRIVLLGALVAVGTVGCAAIGGWGAKVPVVGSDDFKAGNFPDPSTLPTVERSAGDLAEFENNSLVLCDYTAKPPKIDTARLTAMEAAIRFWVKPPKEDKSVGEALGLDKSMVDGISSALGFAKVEKFSVACQETNAAIHVNGTWFGPFDVVHGDTGALGKIFLVSGWSTQRRHLLYAQVPVDPEQSVNPTILTDFSRYVTDKDAKFGARMSMGSILEATIVKTDRSGGWFLKTPYGGGVYGAFKSTISVLKVTP